MISVREVTSGLYGAWRLALRDKAAMAWFDRSLEGTIRSFWAAAICYPGFVVLLLLHLDAASRAEPVIYRVLLVETIGYVVGWTAYPLLALPFCRWLVTEDRALGFVIAYNWSQVLQTALLLVVGAAVSLTGMPDDAAAYLGLAASIAILVYEGVIAWIALDAGVPPAIALVLLDLVLGAFLSQITLLLGG
jgi:hypothetical protein